MNICTIIARNYAAHARVLGESFKRAHPDGTFSVLVVDDPTGFIDSAEEPFEVLAIDEIGIDDPERMAASYDVMELSTAVKPWLLRHLLKRPGVETVAYLDPDIRIFGSIEEIAHRAREHGVVLTPHFTAPLPRDEHKPSEEDILIAGTYNLGFIGLGDGETTHALLDWWSERLEHHCLNDPEQGRFVDQRWIDLAPGIWPGIDVLRDPTFNVAYWNLPTRRLEIDGEGYLVDGEPLRFFHFSGFDPLRPGELSRHQNRIDVTHDPALSRICGEYAAELLAQGFKEVRDWPYGWDEMANGIHLDRPARSVHRNAVEAGALGDSVFTELGAARFTSYLTDSESESNGHQLVNRYAQALWDTRPDFRDIFPNIDGDKGADFVSWLRDTARDTGISTALLPKAAQSENGQTSTPTPKKPTRTEAKPGVNIVGYISSERGVGEAARQMHTALISGGVPATTIDTPADPDKISTALSTLVERDHPYDVNLICVNADMLPLVATGLGEDFFTDRRTAGLWFWEVSTFPDHWLRSFDHLDEVWVASDYIARALRPLAPIPVETVRLPVTPGDPDEATRAELGMPEGFCFLFIFDYRSVFKRKNPLGLIRAFCDAFEPGEGPSLVIKSICGDEFPVQRDTLAAAARDRPDIHLVEETLTVGEKNAMIARCDCYVSLHRSEGLGLTMAEAMYFGKPVIATAYSGNLDFMTASNSYLVPHTMVEIGTDAPPYPPDGEWAEPDLDSASSLMRQVFENPQAAAERGRCAAADIGHTHSLQAACDRLEERVTAGRLRRLSARIQALEREYPPSHEGDGRHQLDRLVDLGGAPPRQDVGRVRNMAKRLYMRVLQPYTAYQQRVNENTMAALDELEEQLDTLREAISGSFSETVVVEGSINSQTAATHDRLRNLTDDVIRNRSRIARVDELVWAAGAQPYMANDQLGHHDHPILGETIGFRNDPEHFSHGYRDFEDIFRGSEEMIRNRQRSYLKLIADHAPVLDAGCGRGEFLDLLKEQRIEARGVDLDPDMVLRCHEKGLENVEHGDLLDALEQTEPHSLGAVFSAQVIEHLGYENLKRFLELSHTRLKPGGLLIAETVNPHSASALKAFWVDPTHAHPLFPETMLALCAQLGYAAGDIFAPIGSGDWNVDRTRVGEYAIVATAPVAKPEL